MPLHGKIVVVKRSGGDGTEFPLTATCLFGRKPDCDIRIQLPQVSKEHCRIDLNENKEVILTNLSSVNPTHVNGEALQQSERLKHGDVITIIDRSFRFEYPPAPTPKKTPKRGTAESFKVLQDQHSGDTVGAGEKRISQVSKDPHLKDGTNQDNIQRSLEKNMEFEAKDASLLQSETTSPFSDLYQMIKKSLDVKTPARKAPGSKLQTPSSMICTPKPKLTRENKAAISSEKKNTPKRVSAEHNGSVVEAKNATPKSTKKPRRSSQGSSVDKADPEVKEAVKSQATSPQTRQITSRSPKFTVGEVVEQVTTETQKTPTRRRSKEAASQEKSKKRKSGELELTVPQMKKKRVSFGGYLSPELFDKKLPPDSPLRRGATPRKSLCLSKPKQSLLRRASVIGFLKEFDQEPLQSPKKSKTPSPKSAKAKGASPKSTPVKSPKSRSSSPKASSQQNKSPKPKTPSPKRATPQKSPNAKSESPKGRSPARNKAQTPTASEQPLMSTPGRVAAKETSSGKRRTSQPLLSPVTQESTATPAVTPSNSQGQTPTVQGRFSVSRIDTPSPVAEDVKGSVTPKIPLKRKSMKSSARKTPSLARSAVKVMQRRSGISRASLKAQLSFADIVKFGRAKAQAAAAPAKKAPQKRPLKKAVSKPQYQTPAKKLLDHVSTGHANSPATIVVGKALKQKLVQPSGTAPKVVLNMALLKKNMKMDEDLSGISEMFKTPANEKKRSAMDECTVANTPAHAIDPLVMEPSLLNTPEEPGEMMVSPMSLASAVKGRGYNSEAVKRLLDENKEFSFVCDSSTLEGETTESVDGGEELKTPKQKPKRAECLTGVKRLMKTPKQTAEPVEDLRGKLLKTPKQKIEQPECLTGVKRVMKTPKEKAEPVEDLRGKLLKTPKQKIEQPECLTGVKNLMKTPQQAAEAVEDLSGTPLKTPKQAPEQPECLTGVKNLMKTPQQTAEAVEDLSETPLKTPKQAPECLTGVKNLMKTPQQAAEAVEDLSGTPLKTPKQAPEQPECLTGVKNLIKTPRQKSEPIEDLRGNLLKTPKQKLEQPESLTGVRRMMKTPKVKAEPLEDIRGALLVTPKLKLESQVPLTGVKQIFDTPKWDDEQDEEVSEEKAQEINSVEVDVTLDGLEVKSSPVGGLQHTKRTPKVKNAPVEDMMGVKRLMKTPKEKGKAVEENFGIKRLMQSPRLRDNSPVEDFEGLKELMEEPVMASTEQTGAVEAEAEPPLDCGADVAEDLTCGETQGTLPSKSEDTQPEVTDKTVEENANKDAGDQMEVESVEEVDESSAAKEATSQAVVEDSPKEEHQEETAACQVTEQETAAAVDEKKSVRGRRAKPAAAKQEAAEQPEDSAVTIPARARRGRKAEAAAPAAPTAPTARQTTKSRSAKSSEGPAVELVQEEAVPPPPKAGPKPRRGRNAKKASEEAEAAQEAVAEAEVAPEAENPPAEEMVDAKPKRGRKARQEPAAQREDLTIQSEERPQEMQTEEVSGEQTSAAASDETKPSVALETESKSVPEAETAEIIAVIAPKKAVRGRRAKVVEPSAAEEGKTEAAGVENHVDAPVPRRRGRKAEAAAPPAVKQTRRGRNTKSEEPAEIMPEKVVEPEVVAEVSAANHQVSIGASQEEPQEPASKPRRGRTPKAAQPQHGKENTSDQLFTDEHPQEPKPTAGTARRGRKPNPDAAKQAVEEAAPSVESSEEPPVRNKRGRNAKTAEVRADAAESTELQKPSKTSRRTRTVEQDHEEPQVEAVVPEEAEPMEKGGQTPKNKRGGRRTKQDAESVTLVESTETHCDGTAPADKPKRGRRAKPAEDLAEVTEEKAEAEEKQGRARSARAPQVAPAKRARRGAAASQEDTKEEAPVPAEPPRKGRRGAAKPATPEPAVSVDQVEPAEDSAALTDDTQASKKSVKWEDMEAPKATPMKAVRGRKSKRDQNEAVSKEASTTEEKVLSDDVEAQPAKRARRGAKVADEAEPASKVASKKGTTVQDSSETQPKTRRGRSAKK